MGLADDMYERIAAHGNASIEYAAGDYRLSLNPIEDRYQETGFILWWQDASGSVPVAVGRAVGKDIVLDDTTAFDGSQDDLEEVLASLLGGQEVVGGGGRADDERAIPTGA